MRRHPDRHQLGNVIGTPSQETLFTAKVKAISSQVQNTFRLDVCFGCHLYLNAIWPDNINWKLWKSIVPGRSVPLSKFTVQQNLKNRPGALIGQENEEGYVIHYALLVRSCFFSFLFENHNPECDFQRRFALDNPDLKPSLSELSSPESDRDGGSDVEGEEESPEPGCKRRRNAQDVSSEPQGKIGR